MAHVYDQTFFDWVNKTARSSARTMLPIVRQTIDPPSVVDVGCGEGGWLSIWNEMGLSDVCGYDGSYVDKSRLLIDPERFIACDLEKPLVVGRRFGLAQCLEVAEHLHPSAAEELISSLCQLSDIVLFSAAQPGQGGERHINERRPSYWAQMFRSHNYFPFDCVRPHLVDKMEVSPWYRYNPILFANPSGMKCLSPETRALQCQDAQYLDKAGNMAWKFRLLLLRPLPVGVVSWLSRVRYRVASTVEA
ncbi:class I SAM-dependent methyltransferase [Edaphobacter aggregans]|uniref:class I SAM-dependent methyltransferase n=1 Tax=Edaphobacter aggregans TaxID=570835 RepID=UPI0005588418|nr:methyltransferase domain-containing protein [Edaphobacter aggregans]